MVSQTFFRNHCALGVLGESVANTEAAAASVTLRGCSALSSG